MRHVPTLLRRELGAYFLGPTAYLALLGFLVIAAFNFSTLIALLADLQLAYLRSFSASNDPLVHYVSGSLAFWVALLVAVPALTMRLLAEERRSGTIEVLLTAPVTEAEVVVAKWLAGVVMFWVLLLPFALYLPVLRTYGGFAFDLGPMASLAIGLTTLGMMFVSIGLFFSAWTRNQVEAAIETFVALFVIVLLSYFAWNYAAERRLPWAEGLRFVTPLEQVRAFAEGQLDLRFLALHLSVAAMMLLLTVRALEWRRGR